MSDPSDDPRISPPQALRSQSEALRAAGKAPSSRGHTLSSETLTVLYRMAEEADTSVDCLKILHELQTHQIELDLMQEQNEANERDLLAALTRYRTAYQSAPAGYFIMDRNGRVTESNAAGAALLRTQPAEIDGATLDRFLDAAGRQAWQWRLQKLGAGSPGETCVVRTLDSPPRALHIAASLAPNSEWIFVVLTALDAGPG